jgi:light-regulated signal transduction histidine kinase (bacteriophytochrome)
MAIRTVPTDKPTCRLRRAIRAAIAAWRGDTDAEALERARRAEADARQAVEELARSNRDLEQFAYVASHDLSEPLRTVSSFVKLLHQRYEGRLDAQADELIAYTLDGTERMKTLIEDLLHYSRAGRDELEADAVALSDVADGVLRALHHRIADTGADVHLGPLPVVHGDARQLGQVLQNLVANAVKFVDDGRPVVRIFAETDEDGLCRTTVQDNGIGIDPAYADRVFKMFQRLHGRDAYAGTGMGLAICQRVVERHGGTIWVEPAPGGGSAFRFTLPLAAKAPAQAPLPSGVPSVHVAPRAVEDDRGRAGHGAGAAA